MHYWNEIKIINTIKNKETKFQHNNERQKQQKMIC